MEYAAVKTEKPQSTWKLTPETFGPLWKYIDKEETTDVEWDSDSLWVVNTDDIRTRIDDPEITAAFIERFAYLISNHANKQFSRHHRVLEAETENLRIQCVHPDFCVSGLSMSIRKSSPKLRFTATEAIENGYCDEKILHLLVNCVQSHLNILFQGEPGHGKTEFAKFASSFIPKEEKVITVETAREWHYSKINPGARHREYIVNQNVGDKVLDLGEQYSMAIKTILQSNPDWAMLAEARSREIVAFYECLSTGVCGISTIHTDDVRNLEERACSMTGNAVEEMVLRRKIGMFSNVGVLMRKEKMPDGKKKRVVAQVCFYTRENEKTVCHMIYEDGNVYEDNVPEKFRKIMKRHGIEDPFRSSALFARIMTEKEISCDE